MIVNSKELHLSIEMTNKKEIYMCIQLEFLKEKKRTEGAQNALVDNIQKVMNKFNCTIK